MRHFAPALALTCLAAALPADNADFKAEGAWGQALERMEGPQGAPAVGLSNATPSWQAYRQELAPAPARPA